MLSGAKSEGQNCSRRREQGPTQCLGKKELKKISWGQGGKLVDSYSPQVPLTDVPTGSRILLCTSIP